MVSKIHLQLMGIHVTGRPCPTLSLDYPPFHTHLRGCQPSTQPWVHPGAAALCGKSEVPIPWIDVHIEKHRLVQAAGGGLPPLEVPVPAKVGPRQRSTHGRFAGAGRVPGAFHAFHASDVRAARFESQNCPLTPWLQERPPSARSS